ncbi:MAG: T9SS type A sorting domain-containing protein, partial [Chitinophagales bacterium]
PNNISYFDLYIGAFNYGDAYHYNTFMELKHKYDTDALKDGGYLTVSYDNGETWMNIIEDTVYYGESPYYSNENLYGETQTLFNGEKGFSGKSDGWVSTWFSWHMLPVKNGVEEVGDTTILRFNFISDDVDNQKEGWMIDDIRLYSVDLGTDIEDFGAGENVHVYPNPIHSSSIIELEKTFEAIDVVVIDLKGRPVYHKKHFKKNHVPLEIDGLASGVYFVRIEADNEKPVLKKVIVD